ncbi:MAG: sigma-54-dependent Fis family transcriptional regulator [Candidatus Binataceae bacterium]|nr:sigma-54-dependent Fis family transcriptional regulator [Candidatus Binataceae bacterium]
MAVIRPFIVGASREGRTIAVKDLLQGTQIQSGTLLRSAQMRRVFSTIGRITNCQSPVLIQGESGTGKELVARAVHTMGPCGSGPFVSFNCSTLVDSIAESQLFGHLRGAFTDARDESIGFFRAAHGGTLFLDEIGELPLKLQPKLLRAVETRDIYPVGSTRPILADFRLVVATNRNLFSMVQAGQFREDLYYRLQATLITLPPLRERLDDVAALTGYFIEHYSRLANRSIKYISYQALSEVLAYPWPGNVRELAHAIESAVAMSDGDGIEAAALPQQVTDRQNLHRVASEPVHGAIDNPNHAGPQESDSSAADSGPASLDETIKRRVVLSLHQTAGNRKRAADKLGISRSTLYRMMSRYGIGEAPSHPATEHRSLPRPL